MKKNIILVGLFTIVNACVNASSSSSSSSSSMAHQLVAHYAEDAAKTALQKSTVLSLPNSSTVVDVRNKRPRSDLADAHDGNSSKKHRPKATFQPTESISLSSSSAAAQQPKSKAAIQELGEAEYQRFIVLIDSKGNKKSFPVKILYHSQLYKTAIEDDKEAYDIQVSHNIKISLKALYDLLKALDEGTSVKKLILKSGSFNVLETANYANIQGLIEPTIQLILNEFLQKHTHDKQWLSRLLQLPLTLQDKIVQNFLSYILPCILNKVTIQNKCWHVLENAKKLSFSPYNSLVAIMNDKDIEIKDMQTEKIISCFKNVIQQDMPMDDMVHWSPGEKRIGINSKSGFTVYKIFSREKIFHIKEAIKLWDSSDYLHSSTSGNYYDGRLNGQLVGSLPNVVDSISFSHFSWIYYGSRYRYSLVTKETGKFAFEDLKLSLNGKFISGIPCTRQEVGCLYIFDKDGDKITTMNINSDTSNYTWLPNSSMIAVCSSFYDSQLLYQDYFHSYILKVYNIFNGNLLCSIDTQIDASLISKTLWLPNNIIIIFYKNGTVKYIDLALHEREELHKVLTENPLSMQELIALWQQKYQTNKSGEVIKKLSPFWVDIFTKFSFSMNPTGRLARCCSTMSNCIIQ